jgi:L-fucose isomerase-like protein
MMKKRIQLVASGDSRLVANQEGWPAQKGLETALGEAVAALGGELVRAHPVETDKGHGFIDSQARGLEVFRSLDPEVPIIVATAIWQYSSHVLPGLTKHRAPVLTVANWSGQWPGLVGMLNLNGSLTRAGVPYSSIWSEDFKDDFARQGLEAWVKTGRIEHDLSHVRPLDAAPWPKEHAPDQKRGVDLARQLRSDQALMGIFDEGCMGMYNAIIPDHLLLPLGVFKERMSQAALYSAMLEVSDETARAHYEWLLDRGMRFELGQDPAQELTEDQVLEGLKMYDAAARLAVETGCAVIGIQYQHGLQGLCVASDLAEGLLNNPERPPVRDAGGRVLREGQPIVHFNEVDEGAGLDALLTNRVWADMGLDPATTLHDVRWGEAVRDGGLDDFVWVFEISGSVPPNHLIDGYRGAVGERQPAMYFRRGGSTIKGLSRPGEIVWSRIYVEGNALHMDVGRGGVVQLPEKESQRRWAATTSQWPMMHAVLYGVTRDQFMAKHKANHIQVVYAPDAATARRALVAKASMAQELGIGVNLCGDLEDSLARHQKQAA